MDYKKSYTDLLEQYKLLQAELDLIKSANRNKQGIITNIFQSSSYLIAIVNSDTYEYVDVNETFLNNLGYSREEIIGHKWNDIQILSDYTEIARYFELILKFKSIKNYPLTLKNKAGEEVPYRFSADSIMLENKPYVMIIMWDATSPGINVENQNELIEEMVNSFSNYFAMFGVDKNNKFCIINISKKAEEIESVIKDEVTGKSIEETSLGKKTRIVELLNLIRKTGDIYKITVLPDDNDTEGYYLGSVLSSGTYVVTWEPSQEQRFRENQIKQEILFERFADHLPEMVYEVDIAGMVRYANKQAMIFFGYTKEDLEKGVNISEVFPDDYKSMIENLKSLTLPEQISSNEYLARKKDGSLVPVVTNSFTTVYDGHLIRYRGVITDVSKQKEYENQIIREKAFLEHLYDTTPAAIVIADPNGIISRINREFTYLFGYTPEEAINWDVNDLIVPAELMEEAKRIDGLASLNRKEVRQTIRQDKYGNKIYVSLVATALIINNEIVANIGIYRDITIEKKNQMVQEILFNISNAALKQYNIKEIYQIIVQELSRIWDTNNFFIAIYDKSHETLSFPFFADEKDNFYEIPTKKTITGWVIKNKKSVLLKEKDLKQLDDSGEIDTVGTPCKVWMGVPLRADKDIIGVMCLQDYNDENKFSQDDLYVMDFIANQVAIAIQRRIMLDDLILARQKAEEAAGSKQFFMSTMSHEIRTPLNEVIGITNLLLQGGPREDQMDYIKALKFSGNHLLTLVNDVLDYNKMESGKIIFEQTQFNLANLLDEILRSYSYRSKAKNLDFQIKEADNIPSEIIGDPIRLNQILSNLLSNAIKFTQKGSIIVNVKEISRSRNQSKIEFSVNDTGIGIAKDKLAYIFDSFTQASVDTTRYYGGTGLGLAICKKLVELQGGTISVESEPDNGSSFRFILPFIVAEKAMKQSEVPESYSGLEGKKILVAEDNKINFFVANKFLSGWGLSVTHAENGQIALDLLQKQDFDLVLMDLHMPVMDGIEASRIIRKSDNPRLRDIPIVALTAAIMSENHDKIEDLKINDYVLKPFKPHDLFDRIRKHIR